MSSVRDDPGALQILAFARRVADELRAEGWGDLRGVGWIGPTGHQGGVRGGGQRASGRAGSRRG
ncbi:MAG TPA: hypothetical protein VNK04_04845 [Gemmataceae bacterium]|nr:hypothetical protein [Gemmataceae bacterium]